jgi:hypothetical protein
MGQGFMAIAGSDACVRISGHIRVGVGVGSGSRGSNWSGGPPDIQPSGLEDDAVRETGSIKLDSPTGQGHIYLQTARPAKNW